MCNRSPMELAYLIGGPAGFGTCCDILLRLDDGTELPAHTQILARHSKIFCDMLQDDGGALISASALKRIVVPMTDCSQDTATAFLSAVYSSQLNTENLGETSALPVAGLAHKYEMKVSLQSPSRRKRGRSGS